MLDIDFLYQLVYNKKMDKELPFMENPSSENIVYEAFTENGVMTDIYGMSLAKVHASNEDAFFLSAENNSFGVFDGVGGTDKSELASHLASQLVKEYLSESEQTLARDMGMYAVRQSLLFAHSEIAHRAEDEAQGETTGIVAKLFQDEHGEPYIAIASAGDSRAYRLHGHYLDQMTLDHSITIPGWEDSRLLLAQQILSNVVRLDGLSDSMLHLHKHRNKITSSLGNLREQPDVRTYAFPVSEGEKWLLTSDGVHDNLTGEEMESILLAHKDDSDIGAQALVRAAYHRSQSDHMRAKKDDITVVVAIMKGNKLEFINASREDLQS